MTPNVYPLPRWDLTQLFPEGGDLTDTAALSARVEEFYRAQQTHAEQIQQSIEAAMQRDDAHSIEQEMEHWVALQMELQRARDFCHLYQQQHNQSADALALKSNNVTWFDAAMAPLNHVRALLEEVPPAIRDAWHASCPDLREVDKYLGIWEDDSTAPKLNNGQREAMQRLRAQKQLLQREYTATHQNGRIAVADQSSREKIADLFNQLGLLNWRISHQHGHSTPLHYFADNESIPINALQHLWYATNRLSETSDDISVTLNEPFGTKRELLRRWKKEGLSKHYTWAEARKIITDGLSEFNPELKPIIDRAFDEGWIHAEPRPGSIGNAFTMPGVSSHYYTNGHPYILAEFDGSLDKVITLAHEMGHAVSHILSQQQGHSSGSHSTLMQENFAVMSETLVLRHMLEVAEDPVERALISRSMLKRTQSAIFSQIGHVNFENAIYNAAAAGQVLNPAQMDQLWKQSMMHTTLPDTQESQNGWCNVHHYFSHEPYYMMGYVMAGLTSNTLANRWQSGTPEQRKALSEQWLNVMRAGAAATPEDLLTQMNVRLDDKRFYLSNRQYFHSLMNVYRQAMDDLSTAKLAEPFSLPEKLRLGQDWMRHYVAKPLENIFTRGDDAVRGSVQTITSGLPKVLPFNSPFSTQPRHTHPDLPSFAERVQDARLVADMPFNSGLGLNR